MFDLYVEWVVISPPVTTVKWSDGTTTTAELGANDSFNEREGVLIAIAKKLLSYSEIESAIKSGQNSLNERKNLE